MTLAAPPRLCAAICAAILAGSLGYGLLQMPLQVHDSLDEIVAAERSPGVWASFTSSIGVAGYFRPLRIAETKLLLELSGGRAFAAYKAFHIALVMAAFGLFIALLRIETGLDLAVSLFALSVFAGIHTFLGLVKEAYPVNHFLQVVVLVLVAMHLSRSRGALWIDVAALLTLVAACLTLESGVLVWVVLAASRMAGRRGVSDGALMAATVLVVTYLVVRFTVLPHGMQNASGYLAERLEPEQIRDRFGPGLSRFTIYTVLASICSVLVSEPRAGTFVVLRAWDAGNIPPRMWINIVSSLLTTVLIALAAWRVSRPPGDGDAKRHRADMRADFLIFGAVLAVSGAASFTYAKDEIMSVAGVCYALVAFWAVRDRLMSVRRPGAAVVLATALLVASSLWAVRVIGVQHVLRTQAFAFHNDWATVRDHLPDDPTARSLVTRLRTEALSKPVVNPWFVPRWADRVFDIDYF